MCGSGGLNCSLIALDDEGPISPFELEFERNISTWEVQCQPRRQDYEEYCRQLKENTHWLH